MKPSVVIQTDFSLTWPAVAEMKGVMKMVDPTLDITDITHEIKKFDAWEASLSLEATEPFWPAGTVFVSVVDAGVGTERTACVARLSDGSLVVTPDNGTLTHLLHSVGIEEVRKIDESTNRYSGTHPSQVFHGRDVFGYCAARLAAGVIQFEEVGPSYPVSEIVECDAYYDRPVLGHGHAEGFITTGLRHFGCLNLSISNEESESCGFLVGDRVDVEIEHEGITVFSKTIPFCSTFGEVAVGKPLLYQGSSGYLSLDINQGNFMEEYGIESGIDWRVTLHREDDE